ncbi:hypothetical protein HELRODRAFT_191338, partial [Helobdella robusta]|uniref:Uncharacterized protein n=1 Tax=Helobdella robusta TaxID=6412 RepID=T1FSW6_HELRO
MKTLNKLSKKEDNYNGFVSKLGLYEEKRQQLQAMRKEEYNKFIAQKESKSPNNNNNTTTNNNNMINNKNNLSNINNNINNNFNNNNNNRARAGDLLSNETATRSSSSSRPTYEDILQRKRLEEQNYRQNSNLNLLDASTTAAYPTINSNNSNNNSNNNNKMISNVNNVPTQEPIKPDLIRHDPINIASPSKVVVHPSQTATTATHPNKFAATEPATLMIGKELSAEENYRKKEQYRLELFKQMKEKQQNKLNRENAPQVAQQNFHDNDVAKNNNLNNKNNNNSYNNVDFSTKPNDINATPYNNFDSINNNNNKTLLENNFHYINRFNANNINNNNNPLSEQALQQQLQLMNLYRMYNNNNNNPNNINFHNNNIPSTLYSNPIP